MAEPFRLGIRAFSLKDPALGSFVMLNRIRYEAEVCSPYGKKFFKNYFYCFLTQG